MTESHEEISTQEVQSMCDSLRTHLPGAIGRTDVSLQRKRELVLEHLLREVFGAGLGLRLHWVYRVLAESLHSQNVYNEICRLVWHKSQFRAEQFIDQLLEGVFPSKQR